MNGIDENSIDDILRYRLDLQFSRLEVVKHYYNPTTRAHLYVIEAEGNNLCGFRIRKSLMSISYVEEESADWELYDCHESLTIPRTMGEVFTEWYDAEFKEG